MRTLLQDLRYGARMLLKNPGFTLVAVITLALGIGATTMMFSVINGVLLRPLSYPDPHQLATIWQSAPTTGYPKFGVSEGLYEELRDHNQAFREVAAYHNLQVTLSGTDEPERIRIAHTSVNTLASLGLQPALGREFLPEEGKQGRNNVALLGYGLWKRRFGSEPNVIGRVIRLDGANVTIVGVLPAGLQLPGDLTSIEKTQLWIPEIFPLDNRNRWGSNYLTCIARMKPGVTMEKAQADIWGITRRVRQEHKEAAIEDPAYTIRVAQLQKDLVGDMSRALWVLGGAVGLVLLIACANIANLLMARAMTREREIAIRTALGAGRSRLVRQLLTESMLLALLGGMLGILLAGWGMELLSSLRFENLPRLEEIHINRDVLLFSFAVSLVTSILFGLAPALHISYLNLNHSLHEEGRGLSGGRARRRMQRLLVVVEVALAVVLVVGAGLLAQSLYRLMRIDTGFKPGNLLTLQLAPSSTKYSDNQSIVTFYSQLLENVRALPGVLSAASVNVIPLAGFGGDTVFDIEGRPPAREQMKGPGGFAQHLGFRIVSPGYFETLGIQLIRGRTFTAFDHRDAKLVTIINETMARRFWPGEDPIGRRIRLYRNPTETGPWMEIAGVVGDTKIRNLTEDVKQEIFMPHAQSGGLGATLVVRTSGDPKAMLGAVSEQIRTLDRDLPIYNIRTMEEVLAGTISQPRLNLMLLAIFAGLAMVMALVGVYGLLSYTVNQRTREIGIRLALGAQRRDVLKLVIGQGLRLVLIGIGIGLAGAMAMTRVMKSLLFGVSATDPATFAVIAMLLAAVALLACYLPARRATKVDPMVALRYE
jgi:putative ABC transport system permease protein